MARALTPARGRWKNWATGLWIATVLVTAAFVARSRGTEVADVLRSARPLPLAVALVLVLAAKLLLARVLRDAAARHGVALSGRDAASTYHLSQLAKYIPGSIWHFATKAAMLAPRFTEPANAARIMTTEVVWVLGSALVVGVLALTTSGLTGGPSLADVLPAGLAGSLPEALIIGGAVVIMAAALVLIQRRTAVLAMPGFAAGGRLLAIWIALGLSMTAVVAALDGVASALPLVVLLVGAFALSYVVGFLAPFAPAGIGVREGALVVLAAPMVGVDTAIVAAALSRAVYVLAELVMVVPVLASRLQRGGAGAAQP